MRILFACLCGAAVLAFLVLSGLFSAAQITHPFWQMRASLTGGLVGMVLGGGLLWLTTDKPALARSMTWAVGMVLAVVVFATWRAAQTFINSADFEATASLLWYFGYHSVAASLVALVAMIVSTKISAPKE